MSEPILHLAKRARKDPSSLRAAEIRTLADWVVQAYTQKLDELNCGRIMEHSRSGALELLGRAPMGNP